MRSKGVHRIRGGAVKTSEEQEETSKTEAERGAVRSSEERLEAEEYGGAVRSSRPTHTTLAHTGKVSCIYSPPLVLQADLTVPLI